MPVATKVGEKVTEGLAKQAMERAVEKGVETMVKQPKPNPLSLFSRANILLAIWYTFTSSNDTYTDKQLYQQAAQKEFKDQTANETWAREHHRMDYPDGMVEKKDDSRDVVYRGGAFTPTNFTPRPGKDDGESPKSGLSHSGPPYKQLRDKGERLR
jgi:hypothetical protein